MVDAIVKPPISVRTLPPSPGATSVRPMNQESTPGPVAIACHTCSGVASTSTSSCCCHSRPTSGLLRLGLVRGRRPGGTDGGMDGNDDAVHPAAGRRLVVVPADEGGDRPRQLVGERRPVGGG